MPRLLSARVNHFCANLAVSSKFGGLRPANPFHDAVKTTGNMGEALHAAEPRARVIPSWPYRNLATVPIQPQFPRNGTASAERREQLKRRL